ncbi:regulator of G-protein signaling 22-like [Branchiostoma lanceolatum]|uniref:regulator of G-protein signaling 22-like n=1 Tax=Branchiostoma lanceolatum TaxID=7740 RepID=UPI003455F476
MPVLKLSSEPPVVDSDNLELFLDHDGLFVEYFNAFLGLPSFALRLRYNAEAGAFDMVGGGCWACRAVRAMNRGENPAPFLRESRRTSREDNSLGAQLDKLQGLVWIKVHRLPAFLQSRYYSKYRLNKLLSQVPAYTSGLYLHVDPDYRPWAPRLSLEDPEAESKDIVNDEDAEFDRFVKSMCVCLGETSPTQTKQWYAWAKQAETTTTTPSEKDPNAPPPVASYGSLFKQKGFDAYMAKPPLARKKKAPSRETVRMTEHAHGGRALSPYLHSPAACMGVNSDLNALETEDGDTGYIDEDPSGYLAVYGRGISDKATMAEFGEFLKSTSGEVKWSLWLDADQTRFIPGQCIHKMGEFLAKLQTKYLHSSSPLRLSTEMEQKLGLQRIRDWRPLRLQEAQSLLVQPLLQYWLPRFLRSKDEGSPLISYEGSDVSVESLGRPTSATSLGFETADVTSRPQSCIPRLRSSTDAARRIYGAR